jgi:exonuclease V gamma subunit
MTEDVFGEDKDVYVATRSAALLQKFDLEQLKKLAGVSDKQSLLQAWASDEPDLQRYLLELDLKPFVERFAGGEFDMKAQALDDGDNLFNALQANIDRARAVEGRVPGGLPLN